LIHFYKSHFSDTKGVFMRMAGALSDEMLTAGKYCANCYVFDWIQPNEDVLKRCTGCRVLWYCDDKCQKEHWHNTHKRQCKYMSNKKVLRNAKHEETSCLLCKEEAHVGKVEMSKQGNPTLPCTMSRANKELMDIDGSFSEGLPYAVLAEMTGLYHTKVEAIIVTFMRILVKMKMTKHSLWQVPQTAVDAGKLYKMLWEERIEHLKDSLTFKKPGPLEGQLAFDINGPRLYSVNGIFDKMVAIGAIRLQLKSMGIIDAEELSSVFQPWGTLNVLLALLVIGNKSLGMYAADCVGLVGLPEEIGKVRTTAIQFNKMRNNAVSLLSGGLVPFTSILINGLCDGISLQQCYVCRKKVTARRAALFVSKFPGDPVLVLEELITYTLCGRDTCLKDSFAFPQGKDLFVAGKKELYDVYTTLCGEHVKELCDYCGKPNNKFKGSRCSGCLTKLYCGVECQMKDTYHLQTKCDKGEQRKKKRSGANRKKDGRKIHERGVSGVI